MRRGEVWTVSGRGHYAGKPRPAVIIQSDLYDALSSVTLCALTATIVEAPSSRPIVRPAAENGLLATSYAMIDKITTVPAENLGKRIGSLSEQDMARIDGALALFLGLAS